jgi:hypothetical protein
MLVPSCYATGMLLSESLLLRELGVVIIAIQHLPTPPCRAPLSCRFFILGEPQNKNAAPRRGISP